MNKSHLTSQKEVLIKFEIFLPREKGFTKTAS